MASVFTGENASCVELTGVLVFNVTIWMFDTCTGTIPRLTKLTALEGLYLNDNNLSGEKTATRGLDSRRCVTIQVCSVKL